MPELGTSRGLSLPWRARRPKTPEPETAIRRSRTRRGFRHLGTALLVLGAIGIAYGATIYFWRDPVTDLYARWKQHQLAGHLEQSFEEFRSSIHDSSVTRFLTPPSQTAAAETGAQPATPDPAVVAAAERAVAKASAKLQATVQLGQALGRISIPRLGVHPVFVHGTRWAQDLSRGPGHYPQTALPGSGKVIAIAGHRTTFGAWFRHIDRLRPGDTVDLQLAYGTFRYRVFGHEIVDNGDWSIIRPRGFETLVLSACHPLYSASHRWIVFARLVRVDLPNGFTYSPAG